MFYLVLSWNDFISNYSFQSFQFWCNKFCEPRLITFLTFLFVHHLKLSLFGWGLLLESFSSLYRDVQ